MPLGLEVLCLLLRQCVFSASCLLLLYTPPPPLAPLSLQLQFLSGGPRRMRHTLPPLAFSALRAVREVAAAEQQGRAPKASRKLLH